MKPDRTRRLRRAFLTGALAFGTCLGNLARAEDRISVGTSVAAAGDTGIEVPIRMTNDVAVHGFSAVVRYDPSVLTLQGITKGSALLAIGASFFSSTVDGESGLAVIGSIFSLNSVPFRLIELPASPVIAQEVAILRFDLVADARAGDTVIDLMEVGGDPPVSSAFSVAGQTVGPALTAGAVSVINENVLRIGVGQTPPGGQTGVFASAKHTRPLEGFQIAFTYDKSLLTSLGASWEGTEVALAIHPETIEFFAFQEELDFSPDRARASVAAVLDFTLPANEQVVPASPDEFRTLCRFDFEASPTAVVDTGTPLTPTDVPEVNRISNLFIIDRRGYPPDFVHGGIAFVGGVLFRRGEVNGDGRLDISDVIGILTNIFLGATAPICIKAANVNDDSRYDISDPIYLLGHLFSGTERPPPPFDSCGVDPTEDDGLSCDSFPECAL